MEGRGLEEEEKKEEETRRCLKDEHVFCVV